MLSLVFDTLTEMIFVILIGMILSILINYKYNKEFRKLINKIKRVISSPEKAKITQIQDLLYNYFFID